MSFIDDRHPAAARLRQIRSELAELQAEHEALADAPLSVEEIEQRLRSEVERISHYASAPLRDLEIRGNGMAPPFTVSAELMISLDPEGFIKRAMTYVRARAKELDRPSAEERSQRMADLVQRIVQLEVEEETEILRLEDQGHLVARRPDVNPRLIEKVWGQA